jgi:hypothetical protein
MSTGLDLVTRSVKSFNGLGVGETMDGTEAQEALVTMNSMLASWQADGLMPWGELISAFNLVNGTVSYTYGTGGVFNAARPQKINKANLIVTTQSPVLRIPLDVLSYQEFAEIQLQALPGTYPSGIYPDWAFPLMTVYLAGTPGSDLQLELYTWQQLQNFAALSDSFNMPPEYEEAIIYNLALRLAPSYGLVANAALAATSKSIIERLNSVTPTLASDHATLPSTPGFVSIYSGQ